MKKLFAMIAASMLLNVTTAMAQSESEGEPKPLEQLLVYENPTIYIALGDIRYEPKTVAQKIENTVVNAITTKDVSVEVESVVPAVKEALTTAATRAMRFQLLSGEPNEQQFDHALRYTATITGCNYTNRMRNNTMDKYVTITAFIYLTNMKTGEVMASRQVTGETWAGLYTTTNACYDYAVRDMMNKAIDQFNAWYPLRGHMLDKGFQKGKKQKLKEIYIDLGSGNGLGRGYAVNVYTVRRIAGRVARHYIGRGVVAEVLGDDISSVTLKRGADDIKAAFDNGAEIAISVQ